MEADEESDADTEDEPVKGFTFEAWRELEIWQRKAAKAVKAGKPLPLDFVCHHIPDNYADTIKTLLARGEVDAAFAMKYESEPPPAAPEPVKDDTATKELAAALDRAAAAAMQPAVKAEPMPQPVINVTMPAITLNAQMPQQDAPTVTVNIPDQPAPVVTVTNEVTTPDVTVTNAPAQVTVNVPPREPITAELYTDPRTGKKILKAK
jgi:hypothetical protein